MSYAAPMFISLTLALLAVGGSFDTHKKDAVSLDHPADTIKVLAGVACDAGGGALNGECLENTKGLKEKVAGKVLLDLGTQSPDLLSFGGRDGAKTRFVWAPLYDVGNGIALTVGKPLKIAEGGNVVMQKRPIDGESPDDLTDLDLKRVAMAGMVGVQIVGRFGKTWTMASPAGKTVKGVLFEVEAVRLYNGHSGATLFESTQTLR